jgi:hypothetical protein
MLSEVRVSSSSDDLRKPNINESVDAIRKSLRDQRRAETRILSRPGRLIGSLFFGRTLWARSQGPAVRLLRADTESGSTSCSRVAVTAHPCCETPTETNMRRAREQLAGIKERIFRRHILVC